MVFKYSEIPSWESNLNKPLFKHSVIELKNKGERKGRRVLSFIKRWALYIAVYLNFQETGFNCYGALKVCK